jgi:Tfp pilus assembly protein PilF
MLITFLLSISFIFHLSPLASPAALQTRNTIEGRVTTADNRPLSDMRVLLQNEGNSPVGSTYTDASGRFRFHNLISGNYTVEVEPGASEFQRQSQRVEVQTFMERSGEVFRVDIVLVPRKSSNFAAPGGNVNTNSVVFHQEVPEAAKKEYDKSLRLLEKDDFENATQCLKKAVELFPNYYDALELMGTQYVKRNDYKTALPLLIRAVQINKNGWNGFYSLGIAQVELNQRNEGIKSLKQSVALNPNSANANMRLGMVLAQDANAFSEAIQAFERVIKIVKDEIPQAYFYLGALYSRTGQFKEAATAFQTFLNVYPQAGEKDKIKKMIEELKLKAKEQKK